MQKEVSKQVGMNLNNMARKVEIWVRDKELTQALETVFAQTVDGTGKVLNRRSFSSRLAQSDEVVLDAAHEPRFKLVQPEGVFLQLDGLVGLFVVADYVVG